MINISKIYKTKIDGYAKLAAEIKIDNKINELFYETNLEYYDYLCDSNADAFVLALLPFALSKGYDIKNENPISEKLIKGLKQILIPALLDMNSSFNEIDILGQTTQKVNQNYIKGDATGISCGVDSFYTVLSNINNDKNKNLKYLTYFYSLNYGESYIEKSNDFQRRILDPKKVTNQLKMTFIPVFSNVNCFMKDFAYEQIHTFSNLSHALALQNIINNYYYSTAYPHSSFKLNFQDSSNYDYLTQTAIKTGSFQMVSYGGKVDRLEKTNYIASFEIVQNNLDVCLRQNTNTAKNKINCSHCAKCIRTMVSLEVCGHLDKFHNVFDLDAFYSNLAKYWGDIIYRKTIMKSEFSKDIITLAREKRVKIPMLSYVHFYKIGVVNQRRKLLSRLR